jgi:alpha-tubulin suppressor-like RCC1 family protein
MPVRVPGEHAFVALTSSPGGNRTCGLTRGGDAWCWSQGVDAALGAGQSPVFAGPDRIAGSSKFVSVGTGGGHGCGIDAARNVSCWGSNQFGQLCVGSSALAGGIAESPVPIAVQGGHKFNRIAAAPGYSCGLHVEGSIYCWGLGFVSDAGGSVARAPDRRSIPHGSLPVLVEAAGAQWVALGAGTTQTCALGRRRLYCFVTTPTQYRVNRRRSASKATRRSSRFGGRPTRLRDQRRRVRLRWGLSHAAGRPRAHWPARRRGRRGIAQDTSRSKERR